MPVKPSANCYDGYTSMVNRHVGTAYDNVRIVAKHIAEVINLSDGIEAVSLYLGAFPNPPTEGWNTEPLKTGNFYLNTSTATLEYYDAANMEWVSVDEETVVQAAQAAVAARDAALLAQVAAELAETNAESSAAAALQSEQNAALAEANSQASASASASSASDSATSAVEALASENAAKESEIASAQSESNAATSETNAANSASAAATSESNAGSSEAAAANSAIVAAGYAADAEAAFDNFTDLYLGAKATDPTVDNDGNPLQVGATYWNTVSNDLRYWSGAAWDIPEQTAIQAANDAIAARDDAQLSETNAAASEASAAQSETNAATSEANALASENAAATSESNAATSETNASTSAANAVISETNAAISAANAEQAYQNIKDKDPDYIQLESTTDIAAASGFDNGKIIGVVESGSLKQYEVGETDLGSGIQMSDGKFANLVSTGGSGGTGEVNTASNLGTGSGLFAQKNGVDLEFKSVKAIGGAQIESDSNSVTINTSNLIPTSEKGVPNGVATIQGDGKIPASQLPSYVDDVLEFPSSADFPATGESGKIYVALDTNAQYRWAGSTYVEFGSGSISWGAIVGTLANQADLQSALDSKLETVPVATSSTFGGFKYTLTDGGTTLNLFT